ncbi:unnamed protein product [Schistosoma turkestanicum]|nr:unnamed protein product [Schistosoma turkestanicum]
MVFWIHELLLVLSVTLFHSAPLVYGAHSWTPSHILSISNSSLVDHHDADGSQLSYIKVGLAAAFFFTVLFSCGLPVLLINYLKERNNLSSVNSDRKFHLGRVQQNGSDQNKIENRDDNKFQYCDMNLSPTSETSPVNVSSGGVYADNNASWKRAPFQQQTSVESESLSISCQSPNPGLISGDQSENRDLLTGEVVHNERNWANSFRIQDRIRGRNLTDHSIIHGRRDHQKQEKQILSRKVCLSSRAVRKETLQVWFSRCNCFAAGVFLSSGFMELYPDTEEAITEAKLQLHIKSEFPFAPFLTLVGFFLVLSIEQIIWTAKSNQWTCCRRNSNTSEALHCDSLHPNENDYSFESNGNFYLCNNDSNNNNGNHKLSFEQSQQNNIGYLSSKFMKSSSSSVKRPSKLSNATNTSDLTSVDRSPTSSTHSGNDFLLESSDIAENHMEDNHHCHDNDGHHHSHTHDIKFDASSFGSVLRVILLLCAMSVHSIFEGLAVGLQPTTQRTVALFTAILLHKIIIAIGIGVNLATNLNQPSTSSSQSSYCHLFMYQSIGTLILACSSPFGVLVGCGLMQQKQSAVLTMSTAVLQGLACGTFFYVVFCELLPVEFKEGVKDRMGKFFFLLFGFLVVALYAFLMPE